LRILFVSSEAYPLIKTGGLADVSGSLPYSLSQSGADVKILIPGYPAVLKNLVDLQPLTILEGLPGIGSVRLMQGRMPDKNLNVIVIVNEILYQREGGPYNDTAGHDWPDNPLRFGILSYVAARLGSSMSPLKDWIPDIVHCNDWQTGLAPAYMHYMGVKCAKSVLSIHNIAFQGCFSPDWVAKLNLPAQSYQMHGMEFYGQMSFLKAGLYYANMITTVSPTYADEIQTEAYGFGMQGLLRSRRHEVHGILNGIETEEWNPATDPHLVKTYTAKNLANKDAVKQALQKRLGLRQEASIPLFGIVSRLTNQKGLDMVLAVADELLKHRVQFAVLGSGERELQAGFRRLATRYPEDVSVTIGYNEELSHQIMAGADIFIMPSRFEPCGLNQMYGLRYGTPSIVTKTGGLADSITDTNDSTVESKSATGFVMQGVSPQHLLSSALRSLYYYKDKTVWKQIQRNGMKKDLSWKESAHKYLELYKELLGQP
jgi:starch synthase